MEEILEKYLKTEEIELILSNLNKEKQRTTYINKDYFIKIGKNTDELFFNNLLNEIELYKDNTGNINLPVLIDSYVSKDICIIIQKKINGNTLGKSRNDFNIDIGKSLRLKIANRILEISNMNFKVELKDEYNAKKKIDKYLKNISKYLCKKDIQQIKNNYDIITNKNIEKTVAHGDLITTNIMLDNDNVYFIDWEFISLKPKYYDLAYFLLFSKEYDSLDILEDINNINVKNVYKEAILICLKEINNNLKLIGKIDDSIINKNINRWKVELELILYKIEE